MTTGRRITGVVLIALAVALAVTSIFVPWMLQERTVHDCTERPCTGELQDLSYGTRAFEIETEDDTTEFLYNDVEDLAKQSGDDVPGLLTIDIGFIILLVAAAELGLGLILGLASLGAGRGLSMTASVFSAIGAILIIAAMAVLVVGINVFSEDAEDIGAPGEVVDDGGVVAAYGVGLSGAAFFAGLFGAILLPAPPPSYEAPDEPMFIPDQEPDDDEDDDTYAADEPYAHETGLGHPHATAAPMRRLEPDEATQNGWQDVTRERRTSDEDAGWDGGDQESDGSADGDSEAPRDGAWPDEREAAGSDDTGQSGSEDDRRATPSKRPSEEERYWP